MMEVLMKLQLRDHWIWTEFELLNKSPPQVYVIRDSHSLVGGGDDASPTPLADVRGVRAGLVDGVST